MRPLHHPLSSAAAGPSSRAARLPRLDRRQEEAKSPAVGARRAGRWLPWDGQVPPPGSGCFPEERGAYPRPIPFLPVGETVSQTVRAILLFLTFMQGPWYYT